MKVLGVIILHPLRKTHGAIIAGYELSKEISKVMPYTLAMMWDKNETYYDDNLEVVRFRCNNPFTLFIKLLPRWAYVPLYSSKIPDYIGQGNFDLVHIHSFIPTFAIKRIAKKCRQKGIPYCISAHGFTEFLDFSKIHKFGTLKSILIYFSLKRPFLYVIKNASWIFTLSPNDGKVLEKLNFPEEQSSCVTNGVKQVYLEKPLEPEIESIKNKLGLKHDKNSILLFVGSLYIYKGIDTFISCLNYISYPVTAVIGGKFKSNVEKNDLLKHVNNISKEKHRIIFTGWLSEAELRSLFHVADILVYPTRGDSLPLVILEAMACYCPVISTEIGGIPFQLANGAGFIASPPTPEIFAQIADKLIKTPGLRKKVSLAARKRIDELFNWRTAAQDAIKGYKQILSINDANI